MKKFTAKFYNNGYYEGNGSCYIGDYNWEGEKEISRGYAKELKRIYNPKTVLDIGCAKGFLMRALGELKIDAYGCDITNIDIGDKKKVCDVRDGLPYDKDSFDICCSYSTFEHIDEHYINKLMKEVYRVARHGFYLEVPIGLKDYNDPIGDISHVTYYTPSFWISKAFRAGWLVDLRKSWHKTVVNCQNVHLAFFKKELSKY